MFNNNELVFETEVAKWFTNNMTKSLDEWLYEDTIADSSGLTPIVFNDLKAYWVNTADNRKAYVLVDNNKGQVVYEGYSFEAVCCYIDMLRVSKRV